MSNLWAILMAGGSGTRFWPASRQERPKQFLAIGTDEPLLRHTSTRLLPLIPPRRQLVITSAATVEAVRDLLPEIPPEQVVGEPEGRDTAPCIGLAGRLVARLDDDAVAVAMPSDHVIDPVDAFLEHLRAGAAALERHPEAVLVFGVQPDRPATGYGYLRAGEQVDTAGGHPVHRLDAFVEKPERETAEKLLEAGGHYWNAGLFAFRPAAMAAAYEEHLPAMTPALQRLANAFGRDEFEGLMAREFPGLQRISIDFGVMEKLAGTLMMPLAVTWDDVGSWSALARLRKADRDGNVVDGDGLVLEGRGNIVSGREGLVVVKGLDDLIVVHTPDVTLVLRRDDDQSVKDIVKTLGEHGLERYL